MELSTSTCRMLVHHLPDHVGQIRFLSGVGFRCFDFAFPPKLMQGFRAGETPERLLSELRDTAAALGVRYGQAHASPGNPFEEGALEDARWQVARNLEACAFLGIPYLVVHAGAQPGNSPEAFLERNAAFFRSLAPMAEALGIMVLIENIGSPGDPYFIRNGTELRALVDAVGHPLIAACWDVGHANHHRQFDQYTSIIALGDKLRALHVHDNFGSFDLTENCWRADLHALPFFGTVNYDSVLQALVEIGYGGTLNFEVEAPRIFRERMPFIHNGAEVNKVSVVPLEIMESVYRLMHQIGSHMLASYNQNGG